MNKNDQCLATCAVQLKSKGNEVQLMPAGAFRAIDGRPRDIDAWHLDAKIAAAVIAASALKNRIVIDYEHQSLATQTNGQPAPAAGWFKAMEWREGEGLFAVDVEWTEKARAMIQGGEYQYLSPVISYDRRSGAIEKIVSAALTNTAAIDGMREVTALTREDQIDHFGSLRELVSRHGDEASRDALQKAEEAMANAVAVLSSEVASQSALRRRADELEALVREREVDDVIDLALEESRLNPAQLEAAKRLGKHDLEALKQVLDRPAVGPLSGRNQTGGVPPAGVGREASGLTPSDLHVCALSGRTPEQFAKLKRRYVAEDSGSID